MALSSSLCVNVRFVLTRTKMSKDTVTAVREDGLRYQSKVGGSPFLGSGHTRSCFKCGKHRAPNSLQSIRLLGRNEVVCKPNCKTLP
jgi:hypothetical protein|mmetsp:Transcript_2842/g.7363  ORF Transcript_2842/g.7363 Transcript_2842/m.7363 type:complete len:87 (-) Transcript_2842:705-965(-)